MPCPSLDGIGGSSAYGLPFEVKNDVENWYRPN